MSLFERPSVSTDTVRRDPTPLKKQMREKDLEYAAVNQPTKTYEDLYCRDNE